MYNSYIKYAYSKGKIDDILRSIRIYTLCASCYKKIGASKNVVVPEKFYKIYLIQKSDSTYDAVAWIIPQSTVEEKDAEKYKVSIDEIEKETGLDFFSNIPDNIEEKMNGINALRKECE